MKWEKKGLIYAPNGEDGWRNQFAICPSPVKIDQDRLRIFFNTCDREMIGRGDYIDVDINDFSRILGAAEKPVLEIGRDGCFDDHGAGPISFVEHDGKYFMYYIGFQQGVKVPYYMFCGLAVSTDGARTFEKYSQAPVLDRRGDEVYARCGVHVIKDKDRFKMWYVGSCGEGWTQSQGKLKPLYTMMYTESEDGIHWNNEAVQCMEYANEDEHGFGRPHVWKENGIYRMIYSIRTYSRGYYMGYAESRDGIHWERKDKLAGIGLSEKGWDSENISYGHLFRNNGKTYLFYNGNGCGKTGFGYAELIED